jgi:chorismate mutase / prephenate dehydratase
MADPGSALVHAPAAAAGGARPLSVLRELIDDVDERLVALLNERAALVQEVGRRKIQDGSPVYAPHREQAVLAKVINLNRGPLLNVTLEAIFRELMSGSLALERPLRIGYLGPPGSFSHEAANRQFGSSVSYENLRTIDGVFEEVGRGHVDYGLVPCVSVRAAGGSGGGGARVE